MSSRERERRALFASALAALDRELDWELLGASYCREGGREFFPPEQRAAILDAGLRFAGDVGEALETLLPPSGPGASLYLGAAVAELAPILYETLVAGRRLDWHNVPGTEADELDRALARVEEELGTALPRPRTEGSPADAAPYDHVWCASVLTDPDAFPALHDELYERRGGPLAVGGGDLRRERAAAEQLVGKLVDSAAPVALVSTTDEELSFFERAAERRGSVLEVPERGRLSGIVGDVVRVCRLRPGGPADGTRATPGRSAPDRATRRSRT